MRCSTRSSRSLTSGCYFSNSMTQGISELPMDRVPLIAEPASNHLQWRELPAQNRLAPGLEPAFQHPRIHAAEVHVELQIALEQIRRCEAGVLAQQPRLHPVTDQEHRRRRSMIGAPVRVFREAPAKLAESHHQHEIGRA